MSIVEPASPATGPPARPATIEEWLAIPEERRAELIGGRIVYQDMPGPIHGAAQVGVAALLRGPYHRRRGEGDRPGGWWLSMEADLSIAGMGCRPDLLGWRRDKHPYMPRPDGRGLVTAAPDWICEVLSASTAHVDLGDKRVGYHRAGVERYWLVDPHNATLTVLRWTAEGYLIALAAGRGDRVRLPPFEAVEVDVADLFDEHDEPTPEAAPPASSEG